MNIPSPKTWNILHQAAQNQTAPEQLIIQLLAQNLIPTTLPACAKSPSTTSKTAFWKSDH